MSGVSGDKPPNIIKDSTHSRAAKVEEGDKLAFITDDTAAAATSMRDMPDGMRSVGSPCSPALLSELKLHQSRTQELGKAFVDLENCLITVHKMTPYKAVTLASNIFNRMDDQLLFIPLVADIQDANFPITIKAGTDKLVSSVACLSKLFQKAPSQSKAEDVARVIAPINSRPYAGAGMGITAEEAAFDTGTFVGPSDAEEAAFDAGTFVGPSDAEEAAFDTGTFVGPSDAEEAAFDTGTSVGPGAVLAGAGSSFGFSSVIEHDTADVSSVAEPSFMSYFRESEAAAQKVREALVAYDAEEVEYWDQHQDVDLQDEVQSCLDAGGSILKVEAGEGGSYVIKNAEGDSVFFLKVANEDVYCHSNSKGNVRLNMPEYDGDRVREGCPPHESVHREAYSSEFADLIPGMQDVCPPTRMVVLHNEAFNVHPDQVKAARRLAKQQVAGFFDDAMKSELLTLSSDRDALIAFLSKKLMPDIRDDIISQLRALPRMSPAALIANIQDIVTLVGSSKSIESLKTKHCSVQRFVASSEELMSYCVNNNPIEDNLFGFDQESFEKVCILTALLGETDAHFGQFLVVPKQIWFVKDSKTGRMERKVKMAITKIDNGLVMPEINKELRNCLVWFEESERPLSAWARNTLLTVPVAAQVALAKGKYKMSNAATEAYEKRVAVMQALLEQDGGITLKQLIFRLMLLEKGDPDLVMRKKDFTEDELLGQGLDFNLLKDGG